MVQPNSRRPGGPGKCPRAQNAEEAELVEGVLEGQGLGFRAGPGPAVSTAHGGGGAVKEEASWSESQVGEEGVHLRERDSGGGLEVPLRSGSGIESETRLGPQPPREDERPGVNSPRRRGFGAGAAAGVEDGTDHA